MENKKSMTSGEFDYVVNLFKGLNSRIDELYHKLSKTPSCEDIEAIGEAIKNIAKDKYVSGGRNG